MQHNTLERGTDIPMSENPMNKAVPTNTVTPAPGVQAALNHLAKDRALLGMHRVSAFNFQVAMNALITSSGGELVIKLPTKAGDVVEVTYRGLEARR